MTEFTKIQSAKRNPQPLSLSILLGGILQLLLNRRIICADAEIRRRFINIEVPLINAVMRYQDTKTGLWYQVVDKPNDRRNRTESSCSALFTYAAAKCLRLDIIAKAHQSAVIRGYEGVINCKIELHEGNQNICIGTDVGTEDYYFNRPTSENDLHGMGAFLMMCTEIEK